MKRTLEEKQLLERMINGELDGIVGNTLTTSGGSTVWTEIINGIPKQFKKGPGGRFFNGRENEHYEGVLHTLQQWKTEEEKIQFLRKMGWLIKDTAAKMYSAKYKPQK